MPPYCEKHSRWYKNIDGRWECPMCHAEKQKPTKTDLRTVRQSSKVKLAEIMQNPENIPVVIEHINELCEVMDAAHDIVLDWRSDEELQDCTPAKVSDFLEWLDEGLTRIGYVPGRED